MRMSLRLLIVSHNPQCASFRQRFGVYLPILEAAGIRCEVAVLPDDPIRRLWLYVQSGRFDGLVWHKKTINPIDAFFLRRYAPPMMYNFDDAVMFSDKHPDRDSPTHRRRFIRTLRLADRVLVGSRYLAEQAKPYHSKVDILPLGLDVGRYAVSVDKPTDRCIRLVWIGSKSTLGYLKNLVPVFETLARRYPKLILRIIGDAFFDIPGMIVEKVPWDSETRYAHLAQCDVGLAPLPSDRFSMGKCSFKVLEYSAAGLPVVASPVGTNTDHVVEGVTGFFAERADQWVDHLVQLIEDMSLRQRIGSAGRIHSAHYDSVVIGRKLAEIISNWVPHSDLGKSI